MSSAGVADLPCGARRKTSAAAWWKPSGSPAAAMLAAISSISPAQRQPLALAAWAAPADRSVSVGWDSAHSASRTSSTPSALASARAVSSSEPLPLVHAAYAIFTADAAVSPPGDHPGPERGAVEQLAYLRRPGPGQVQAGTAARGWRLPDDPAIDITAAAVLDHAGYLARGGRRDGVRVDEDPAESLHRPGHVQGRVRRAHRQDGRRAVGHFRRRAHVLQSRIPGPGGSFRAAPVRCPQHQVARAGQALPDGGTHLARMQQPDRAQT